MPNVDFRGPRLETASSLKSMTTTLGMIVGALLIDCVVLNQKTMMLVSVMVPCY